ncbi:MAG: sodium:calcium antiporter [Elusimicrobia bacterium]|nr:sodium:calcium antiporter [Elusimicrobiota bacterium]MDE2425157.1 sodium:calcium antiporter [Elusimicrobiota bacterium]
MRSPRARAAAPMLLAAAACLQWPLRQYLAPPAAGWPSALWAGLSVLGAAFLLSWAGEAAELDVPQGLALAALAVVAVLPEYAVDIYFAWRAGRAPSYAPLATANMTGANRLLIGLGWASVLAVVWLTRRREEIHVGRDLSVDLTALAAASLYALIIPLKGTLSLGDFAVFSLIFIWYAKSLGGAEEELGLEGPAAALGLLPTRPRRLCVAGLFVFSAVSIYLAAKPFAEGLLAAGQALHFNRFFLVQWVAPLASEAPEFTVAVLFAWKGRAKAGLRVLVSSKVSQWTLLVGMIPLVYAVSAGSPAAMPLDALQRREILLTAAQSLFGLALLLDRRFTWKEAAVLAALFLPQPFLRSVLERDGLSAIFFAGALLLLARPVNRAQARNILREALSPR